MQAAKTFQQANICTRKRERKKPLPSLQVSQHFQLLQARPTVDGLVSVSCTYVNIVSLIKENIWSIVSVVHYSVFWASTRRLLTERETVHINMNSGNLPGAHLLLVFLRIPWSQAYPEQKTEMTYSTGFSPSFRHLDLHDISLAAVPDTNLHHPQPYQLPPGNGFKEINAQEYNHSINVSSCLVASILSQITSPLCLCWSMNQFCVDS